MHLMIPAPVIARTCPARSGVSDPCNWMRSGAIQSAIPFSKASSGSTVTATTFTGRSRAMPAPSSTAAARRGETARGLRG